MKFAGKRKEKVGLIGWGKSVVKMSTDMKIFLIFRGWSQQRRKLVGSEDK